MKLRYVFSITCLLLPIVSGSAFAAIDLGAAKRALLEATWPELSLSTDLSNLTGPAGEGMRGESQLKEKLLDVNGIWSQCGIRFVARKLRNVSASELGVTLNPKSQDDLGTIHGAAYPKGHENAIPAMIAGAWNFVDAGFGLYMYGIGWAFTREGGALDRLGAMVSSTQIDQSPAGTLLGHELGHALTLGHSSLSDNVMAGGATLTRDQCEQSRRFVQTSLSMMIVNTSLAHVGN